MVTAKNFKGLLQQPGRYRDVLGEIRGLLLVVNNPRSASWKLRYARNGKEKWLGLGSARLIGLKEARERARAARLLLLDGTDPLDAKRQARVTAQRTLTFAAAAQTYYDHHQAKWANARHAAQFISSMEQYVYPHFGTVPCNEVTTADVLRVLEQHVAAAQGRPAGRLWDVRHESASRIRRRIEGVISWATVRGYRSGTNPATWTGHLREVLPQPTTTTKHFAALPYVEIAAFMDELRTHTSVAARALQFTCLSAARTGETLGAVWSEIDLTAAVWAIPSNRMKGGKEHRVPLSPAAVALLQALPREEGNPFLFIGPRAGAGLPPIAMAKLLRKMGHKATVHGFRSTFRDWSAEQTNYQNHVVEKALAHTISNAVERAYRRGDLFAKRQRLMDDWARYCSSTPASNTVVALRR